jgi:hypothetical protein
MGSVCFETKKERIAFNVGYFTPEFFLVKYFGQKTV